jgi:hypothetical protein
MRVGAVLCALCLATSCGGDRGPDPVPPTTDTDGGEGDGDTQGGETSPTGAPAVDAGGGTGGGGGGAGEGAPSRPASVSIERFDASGECDGLVPGAAEEPIVARLAPPAVGRCVAGLSDGTGAVALGAGDEGGALAWQVMTARGEPAARFDAPLPLLSQPEGWHGLAIARAGPEPDVELRAFGPDGALRSAARLSPAEGSAVALRWQLAEDPRGGAAVVFRQQDALTLGDRFLLHRFDAAGRPRAEAAQVAFFMRGRVAEPMGGGVSTRGEALVLMPALEEWRPTWTSEDGRWVTDGTDRHDVVPLTPLSLHPLLDGGLALRMDGRWTRAYAHLAQASGPAPAWLAERSAWRYRFTRGNRGYAVFQPAGESSPDCTQHIDLVAPSGRLCGRVTLREDGASCTTGSLDQGWDGTVVQQSGKDACIFRWWPRLLAP